MHFLPACRAALGPPSAIVFCWALEVQTRTWRPRNATSGLPRSTDIVRRAGLVRFVPMHKVAALQPAAREQEPRGR